MANTYLPADATVTAIGTINFSVIDNPGITSCSYSIWCSTTASSLAAENTMITVLQVAP
jgi:hypothetical protein